MKRNRKQWLQDKLERRDFEVFVCHRFERVDGRLVEVSTHDIPRVR